MKNKNKKILNPYSANSTKWSNTQTIRWLLPTNCLNVFGHFVGLVLKELNCASKTTFS